MSFGRLLLVLAAVALNGSGAQAQANQARSRQGAAAAELQRAAAQMEEFKKKVPALTQQAATEMLKKPQTPQMKAYLEMMVRGQAAARQQAAVALKSEKVTALLNQADCALLDGRKEEAAKLLGEALDARRKEPGADEAELSSIRQRLIGSLADEPARALPIVDSAIAVYEKAPSGRFSAQELDGALAGLYRDRALALHRLGRIAEAKSAAATALERGERTQAAVAAQMGMMGAAMMPGVAEATKLAAQLGDVPLRRMLGQPVAGDSVNAMLLDAELKAAMQDGRTSEAAEALELLAGGVNDAMVAYQPMGAAMSFLPGLLAQAEGAALPLALASQAPGHAALALFTVAARQGRSFDMTAAMATHGQGSNATAIAKARAGRSQRAAKYLRERTAAADPASACGAGVQERRGALHAEEQAQHRLEMAAYRGQEIQSTGLAMTTRALASLGGSSRRAMPRADHQGFKRALQAALKPNEALVNFVYVSPIGPEPGAVEVRYEPARYNAFILRASGDVQLEDLGAGEVIDAAVQGLLDDVETATAAQVETSALDLGQRLLSPLERSLQGVEHVYLVSDGRLQYVPFDALRVGDAVALDRFRFTHLNSARELVTHANPARKRAQTTSGELSVVTFEVPRVDKADVGWLLGEQPDVLKGVVKEAKAIRALVSEQRARSVNGAAANEASFLGLRSPTVLHFGGHGVFVPKGYQRVAPAPEPGTRGFAAAKAVPMQREAHLSTDLPLMHTALLVAPASPAQPEHDSFVTSYEIARMDLRGTELVVLGACDTANGIDSPSQGIGSLRRAFMMAGAESVLATLWPISDDSTVELMTAFYGNLLKGASRSAALRDAKRVVRSKYPHPRHWAAFTLSGASGPLPQSAP